MSLSAGGKWAAALVAAAFVFGGACASKDSMPRSGPPGPDAQAAELVQQMTLDEKLSLMAGSAVNRGMYLVPGVPRLGIPEYAMTDGPRGLTATTLDSTSVQKATAFPVAMARGATWDEELEERVGEAAGKEARAWGANVLLAPCVNVLRHPAWGRAQETYGEDPLHLGKMGARFVVGAQRHVIADAKHFVANDIEDTRFTVSANMDERTLQEVYLPPFLMTVEAGVGSVMTAYNRFGGLYCSEHPHLLTDVLRNQWGFRGFVVSDWILAVRSTAPSANAGLDLEMPFASFYAKDKLQTAIAAGEISEAVIDGAATHLVRERLSLAERIDPAPPPVEVIGSAEHGALALEVARKSVVLLKNESSALPLDRSAVGSVAVVGTFAGIARLGDLGSSNVAPGHTVTPFQGLSALAGATVTSTHIDADTVAVADESAIAAADAAVVVVGLGPTDEGENIPGSNTGDRDTLGLSAVHEALIARVVALNPRTIVVVEAGSAVTMTAWKDAVPAIVMAFYPGQEGGTAIAEVLFGDVNPSGHLPLTIPENAAQLPPFDNVSTEVTVDYFHGYRHVDRQGTVPAFPFGFGLSYTTFTFSNLTVQATPVPKDGTLTATVDVTNAGSIPGDAVVQLYVGFTGSAVPRPERQLAAFARVALAAGETKAVSLRVPARSLAYYDAVQAAWTVESLSYTAFVGTSSRDLPLSTSFRTE